MAIESAMARDTLSLFSKYGMWLSRHAGERSDLFRLKAIPGLAEIDLPNVLKTNRFLHF